MAGCLLVFKNPSPMAGEAVDLSLEQRGLVGEMTASRKVRVPEVSVRQAGEFDKTGRRGQDHLGNSLYLEWFSERDGRVVLESTKFSLHLTEPVWHLNDDRRPNGRGRDGACPVGASQMPSTRADEPPAKTSLAKHSDEFEWEQIMRKSDEVTAQYAALLKKYQAFPQCDELVARDMGWLGLDASVRDEPTDPPLAKRPADLVPNPGTEGRDWMRTRAGRIMHPLSYRALELSSRLWQLCHCRHLLGDSMDPDMHEMLGQTRLLGIKLAGTLDDLAYDQDPDGGFVVANLKRALRPWDAALAAAVLVGEKSLLDQAHWQEFRCELFAIREDMIRLMSFYRLR
jgi:hypothetical protein